MNGMYATGAEEQLSGGGTAYVVVEGTGRQGGRLHSSTQRPSKHAQQ
jgi:hypothetical protein